MKNLIYIAAVILIILPRDVFSQYVEEDAVYLKNGNVIYGVVAEISSDGTVTIRTDKGKLQNFSMEETDRIVKRNKEEIETGGRNPENQTNSRTFTIGGSIQFSSIRARGLFASYQPYYGGYNVITELKDYTISQFLLTPSLGYFIFDNLAINFQVNFLSMTSDAEGGGNEDDYDDILIGSSISYYFGKELIKPFIGAGVTASKVNNSRGDAGFFFYAGYNIGIARSLALQITAQYTAFSRGDENAGVVNTVSLGAGLQAFVF